MNKFKSYIKRLWEEPFAFSFLSAFLMVLLIEALSRHNFFGGFVFLFSEPMFFLLNVLIIFAPMTLTYFSPKRVFTQFMVLFVFFVMGFVNFVLLFTRTQPFEAVDFSILRTGISIVGVYFSTFAIILIALAIIAALFGIVMLFIKTKKYPLKIKGATIAACIAVPVCTVAIFASSFFSIIPDNFNDANVAYETYGFTYCFGRSIFHRGIEEPTDYSEYSIDEILDSIGSDKTNNAKTKPNIIMIQLESFIDPKYFNACNFSENPIPNFTKLKEQGACGFMSVPSVGSGTANTEFEVLTGMCLDYFGTGEYPFKTILQTRNCETICYDLKELGYSTHAFHNHTGTFYNRNTAYKNLGFDTFTPVEYMHSYETNPMGWVKDSVLSPQIIEVINSTESRDFVFAVTVQGHGKYPSDPVDGEGLIASEGIVEDGLRHELEYYAYQLSETDAFIGELTRALSEISEKCVLVLYGDHLPSLDYEKAGLILPSKHSCEYVIWANYDIGIDGEDREADIEAFQLYPKVLDLLNINNGIITKLHQNYNNSDDYLTALEMLEYDMLYGDLHAYGREEPYTSPDMKLGYKDIVITDINIIENDVYIIGEGFTKSSRLKINGHSFETVYISPGVLLLEDHTLKDRDILTVHQITNDFVTLGKTENFLYLEEENPAVPINNTDNED